ncbi:MAG: hypothetical protein JNJ65_09530 [Cyclobacteriaceae bacterium]|nr:hypothetical protein [Cyclobacteriaceae bacterium]
MKNSILLALILLMAASCQKSKPVEDDLISTTFEAERNRFFMAIQSPAEVAARLQDTGAAYNPGLMNDPLYYSSYTSNEVKAAANLGIYLSDLNYSIAYKQSATSRELFQAVDELSKVVGIEQRVLGFLRMRYEQNIHQNDSVKEVVDELLKNSLVGLQGTDREKFVGIVMAAYQIENLHLALGIIQTYPKDLLPEDARTLVLVPAFQLILAQQENLETIYAFLKTIADPTNPEKNPNFGYYATAFEELIAVYKRLDVADKLATNQGGALMTDAVVNELMEKVSAIRNKVVGL